ncbi:FliH/SctL family protein [Ketobacter alkanivorans]|uniref:Flagellar assembly protein FliH n=1 Tax=Ketobacter alkanivorans TaxID=1917421 RepID=A0A2K9LL20_9GAMM|nr:FliH/SctL family protein [Ketobacter alkanivorans]AUM12960.1 hypothetical protein Kalk_11220 [Ketobacter alkanivorans]
MNDTRVIRSAVVQGVRKIGSSSHYGQGTDHKSTQNHTPASETDDDSVQLERFSYDASNQVSSDKTELDSELLYSQRMIDSLRSEVEEKMRIIDELERKISTIELNALKVESEIESVRKSAQEHGYADGLKLAEDEMRNKLGEVGESIATFRKSFDFASSSIKNLAVELVFASLSKIFGEEYTKDSVVIALVKRSIESIRNPIKLTIRLNERDCKFILPYVDELEKELGFTCDVVADVRVKFGGCILETESGSFDARMESQLQIIKESLRNAIEHG